MKLTRAKPLLVGQTCAMQITMSDTLHIFPPSDPHNLDQWLASCRQQLQIYAADIERDPLTNSVRRLAHQLTLFLEEGKISLEVLAALSAKISGVALVDRAQRFRRRTQVNDATKADEKIANWIERIKQKHVEPEAVCQALEQTIAGVVFTGHPTFALSRALRKDFVDFAEHADEEGNEGESSASRQQKLIAHRHRPDDELTVESEHEDVTKAIDYAVAGLESLNRQILTAAKAELPGYWHHINPAPLSVATWVGYDLDGRTDIHWGQTLTIRLREKSDALFGYEKSLRAIKTIQSDAQAQKLIEKLNAAARLTKEQADLFSVDLNNPELVLKAADHLTQNHSDKFTSIDPIIKALDELVVRFEDDETRMALCLLRAKVKNLGLGIARIHLRINAAQVRSALRHDFGVQSDAEFLGRSALSIAATQAKETKKGKVNFAALFLEEMTARRQFMLCSQILKHIDGDMPIRFLIAECEAPATIMGAVYLARAYGVADRLDISPLFETPTAMERGGRFMERLLNEPEYQKYIQERGRISIQLGFSDSGRFMGQLPADMAIERLHILLARAMRDCKIENVEALIFNTNGESMGRGNFPGTINNRLNHLMTPWAKALYQDLNIPLNVESSFQGGEGFLHFHTRNMGEKTMRDIFLGSCQDFLPDRDDSFYRDINFSWDFYRGVKKWQEDLFEHPDYIKTIATFGQHLLFTTGSRKTRRQRKGNADMSPRALRAIPHNAILQQLGIPANVACGVGTVICQEMERFADYTKGSKRVSGLIDLAQHAQRLTSLPAFLSYAEIFNANYWTRRAAQSSQRPCEGKYQLIAEEVKELDVYVAMQRLANHLAVDLASFNELIENLEGPESRTARHEDRIDLHILHALRQAAVMYGVILVSQLPPFSGRHEVTIGDLIDLTLHLRMDEVVTLLDEIFPIVRHEVQTLSMMEEETSFDLSKISGYPDIRRDITDPIRMIHNIVLETGVGISHFYGAYG